jgi:hypothetical protein
MQPTSAGHSRWLHGVRGHITVLNIATTALTHIMLVRERRAWTDACKVSSEHWIQALDKIYCGTAASCTHILALQHRDLLGLVCEAAQHGAAAHLVLLALHICAQLLHAAATGVRQAGIQPAGQALPCHQMCAGVRL